MLSVLGLGLISLVALTACGGEDIEALAQREGIGTRTGIALYLDPAYVDYAPGSGGASEAENLEVLYGSAPEPLLTFVGTTAADFTTALSGKRVLVIPELEVGDLNAALDPAARPVIEGFVASGGTMIVFYPDFRQTSLVNAVFGTAITQGSFAATYTLNGGAAFGTAFAGGPASLPDLSATGTVTITSLPSGSKSIYTDAGSVYATVAVVPHGAGRIVIMGWDWFDAIPLGLTDGGWLEVLARATAP